MKKIRLLSYNIHKGFSFANQEFNLRKMKEALVATKADIVFLQEVLGQHRGHAQRHEDWPLESQFEFLANGEWPHFSYGLNALYSEGHHGNAILSRYPIRFTENQDISLTKLEKRGLLHVRVAVERDWELDLFCLHLNLFQRHRQEQVAKVVERTKKMIAKENPLVIAGDFNDWRGVVGEAFESKLGVFDVFQKLNGRHAKSFPAWYPLLPLDRIYCRGLEARHAKVLDGSEWRQLSDHLPLQVDIEIDR